MPNVALANTKKWLKPLHDIQVICAEWNVKMQNYEEKGYSEKEALNIRAEEQKLCDIEFLKNKILLTLSPDLTKFLITWIVTSIMRSKISIFTLKSGWLKEHAYH